MEHLKRDDLYSLEQYAEQRPAFRKRVLDHKKNRRVDVGPNFTLYFEDRLTIQYQVQEMLRIEKIFEADAIMEELGAYNPLIPDGHNWKATFMLEYDDPGQRALRLGEMIGIEDKVWLQVDGCDRVYPVADEDLERDNDEKTSSVHFLRFELQPSMIAAMHSGAALQAGIDHPAYTIAGFEVPAPIRDSLADDLDLAVIN